MYPNPSVFSLVPLHQKSITTLPSQTPMPSDSMASLPSLYSSVASDHKLYLWNTKSAILNRHETWTLEQWLLQSILLRLWLGIVRSSFSPTVRWHSILQACNIVYFSDSCNSTNDANKGNGEVSQDVRCNCWRGGHFFGVEIDFFGKSLRECVLCDLDTLGSGTSKDSYMDFEGIYVPLGCVVVWLRFSGVARSHQIVVWFDEQVKPFPVLDFGSCRNQLMSADRQHHFLHHSHDFSARDLRWRKLSNIIRKLIILLHILDFLSFGNRFPRGSVRRLTETCLWEAPLTKTGGAEHSKRELTRGMGFHPFFYLKKIRT